MRHATFEFQTVLVLVAGLAFPTPAEGQEMARVWNGVMELSTGLRVDVFLTQFERDQGVRVTVQAFEGPVSEVTDLSWEERLLRFRWGAFRCELPQDRAMGYTGSCTIEGGDSATLSFARPADLREAEARRSAGVSSGGEVLTTDELLESGRLTLYDAIQHLRPRWLVVRGPNKYLRRLYVYVYADGQRIGDVEALRGLRPEDVTEVRYFNASEATQRFGAINEGGAIALTRRRSPRS